VVAALTAPDPDGATVPSTQPLVAYLRGNGAVSGLLRDALANLLDETSNEGFQLILCRRDGRRMKSHQEVERDVAAYNRVVDLTESPVTEELCMVIQSRLPGWTMTSHKQDVQFLKNAVVEIRLRLGKSLSRNLAIRIAAFECGKPYDTLRKMIEETGKALRDE
jgi:hypothetical protein